MAILFDLDGVFYQGDRPLPGAAETATWLVEQRIPHLYLTNTTSIPRRSLVKKLSDFGVDTDVGHILTPAVVAADWCRQNLAGKGIALFVPDATQAEFDGLPEVDEDGEMGAVIVGDLGEAWDFNKLNQAFRYLMGAPQPQLIALGMTRYWRAEDGLRLDVAAFISALSHASGAEPLVTGKPAPMFFNAALNLLHVNAGETIMIGDDIRGDVEGAQKSGICGVLMRTGKFREVDLSLGIVPDAVLGSLLDLPSWYRDRIAAV